MNISTETREILRNYKAVINARRREMGQKPLTTAQIVDEICDFVANQQAVFLGGHYIRHCCKVSDEAAFCLIQRPYISKTLLTRRISPRGSP
ncbi:hypothetical protein [Morganella morganii]|uniref:hypothetical protein n=1 Tax=Morganella morganii TaxID=582 RepID=UPI002A7505E7|nr:hypothetical protein [Klebsiella pneumoniae]